MTETVDTARYYHFLYDGKTKKTKDLTDYFFHEWCDEADSWEND